MGADLIPFVYNEKLVRTLMRDGEPWFVGKDVCAVLDVRNVSDALERLDPDERGIVTNDTLGASSLLIVSEPGLYRLVFTSRKAEAEAFKRWIAHEVLPQIRKTGRYAVPEAPPEPVTPADAPLLTRLALVREARILYGADRARRLWPVIGLPVVPGAAPVARDSIDGRDCLAHLLAAPFHPDMLGRDGPTVRWAIEMALDEEPGPLSRLRDWHIRVDPASATFVIANRGELLRQRFAGTRWHGCWGPALKQLPGAQASKTMKFGEMAQRGTTLPADALDDIVDTMRTGPVLVT